MRLEWLELQGVGPFENLRLELPQGTKDELGDAYVLVGPNGSGKSTVLMAIAAAFGETGPAGQRMWESGARIQAGWGEGRTTNFERESAMMWKDGTGVRHAGWAGRPFKFWAFAYSGARETKNLRAERLEAPSEDATAYSATFGRPGNETQLAQWVVDNDYLNARAVRDQKPGEAARLAQSRELVERLISELTEQPDAALRVIHLSSVFPPHFSVELALGGQSLPMEVWASGVRASLGWLLDLVMRLDRMPWAGDQPIREREFLLLLDEIDVHLHPGWQRRVLPIVQRAFPKAQIVVSTHSPFVVGSADDARIYPFTVEGQSGRARLMSHAELGMDENGESLERGLHPFVGVSYEAILDRLFGVKSHFDFETERRLESFKRLRDQVISGRRDLGDLKREAIELSNRSLEVRGIVWTEFKVAEGYVARRRDP